MRFSLVLAGCAFLTGCGASNKGQEILDAGLAEKDETQIVALQAIGAYLCTVSEKASIVSSHMEGAGPPEAVIDNQLPTRFRIGIAAEQVSDGSALRLVELSYEGPDRDPAEWHTPNSVLHSPYTGNGVSFRSTDDYTEGSFVLHPTIHSNADGDFSFYHSGFEAAGGEDNILSIRWGRCKKS